MADVRDILDIETLSQVELTKEAIFASDKKVKRKNDSKVPKRPEGMHREVFALLCKDNHNVPPMFPTDISKGYKQMKAKLGMRKARPWKWTPFINPARTDKSEFFHWRRVSDLGIEYPFAKFNKKVPIPSYTNTEYVQHLVSDGWTRAETDHLFDLCHRFDLRFTVIHDRWDLKKFQSRSVEELKSRYYHICAVLNKVKSLNEKSFFFDLEHEQRRKEQLRRLFDRSIEQVEEELLLIAEMRKIEQRKRERDRKTQDLQKLITAADHQTESRKNEKKSSRRSLSSNKNKSCRNDSSHALKMQILEPSGIRFPDLRNCGVSFRSQRMKLPSSLGQKKLKGIEQTLIDMGLDLSPPPTEKICLHFNELRSDIVLHLELKIALGNCDYELQSLKHQLAALNPEISRPTHIVQAASGITKPDPSKSGLIVSNIVHEEL